jgi:glucose-1-phosphate adenylyltransferase
MKHIGREAWKELAILSGDQLYRMDLREMIRVHRESRAAVTVAMKAVSEDQTSGFGIMKVDGTGRVVHFDEKPPRERLAGLASSVPGKSGSVYLASMGIYIFERKALERSVAASSHVDFGKHVLPALLDTARVQAYFYDGHWEDVGTVRSYFDANLALTQSSTAFNYYHPRLPIYTQRPFLSPSRFHGCRVVDALVADGCVLDGADIETAVIGVRSRIGRGTRIKNSLVLGADDYQAALDDDASGNPSGATFGIGRDCVIENAIIDKNARVGDKVKILNRRGLVEHDGDGFYVRDGIVIVPKGGSIADGTEL